MNKTDRAIENIRDLGRSLVSTAEDYQPNGEGKQRVSDVISDLEGYAETLKEKATELWTLAHVDYPDEV